MADDGSPVPDGYECPITQEVMTDPVVAADGQSYERADITRWLAGHNTSPATGAVLASTALTPNVALRKAIAEWRERQPLALDPARLTLLDGPDGNPVVLGAGSFGRVVAGELKTRGRPQPVAVKTLPDMTRAEQRVQFDRELVPHIRAMQAADGVCRVLGTCEKDGRLCLVMRRYERSLADALEQRGGTLPAADVRRYGVCLARTLGELHAAGLVLQDIKPENVLLDTQDSPVYADFGISAVLTHSTGLMPTSVKGTFNYMAPEAFDPPLGPPADVWSLACVLLELSTGVQPWHRLQMQQIITAVLIRKKTPDVPDATAAAVVLRRCFAFAAADRPTAGELAEALEEDGRESARLEAQRQAASAAQLQVQLTEQQESEAAATAAAESALRLQADEAAAQAEGQQAEMVQLRAQLEEAQQGQAEAAAQLESDTEARVRSEAAAASATDSEMARLRLQLEEHLLDAGCSSDAIAAILSEDASEEQVAAMEPVAEQQVRAPPNH